MREPISVCRLYKSTTFFALALQTTQKSQSGVFEASYLRRVEVLTNG